jgi:hypothetical protein
LGEFLLHKDEKVDEDKNGEHTDDVEQDKYVGNCLLLHGDIGVSEFDILILALYNYKQLGLSLVFFLIDVVVRPPNLLCQRCKLRLEGSIFYS